MMGNPALWKALQKGSVARAADGLTDEEGIELMNWKWSSRGRWLHGGTEANELLEGLGIYDFMKATYPR